MFLFIRPKHFAWQDPPWLSLPPAESMDTEFDAATLSISMGYHRAAVAAS